MGLKLLKYTLKNGLVADEIYCKVDTFSGNKLTINFVLKIFVSKEASDQHVDQIDQKYYTFVPSVLDDAKNFIKQAYLYLKTLDEFKNSVDVLEEGQTGL